MPTLKLGLKNKDHRFPILRMLLKAKAFDKILANEISTLDDLAWRPIQGYRRYRYGKWLRLFGKALSTMAKVLYPLGDSVSSVQDMQQKVLRHNRRHGATLGQS